MILSEFTDEGYRIAKARAAPLLPMLGWSLPDLLEEIRAEFFPEIAKAPPVYFIGRGPLACIMGPQGETPVIFVHEILNSREVPRAVWSLMLKHELLHVRIPPALVDGNLKSHPPEFYEAERVMAPERRQAFDWLYETIGYALDFRVKEEGIYVRTMYSRKHRVPKGIKEQLRIQRLVQKWRQETESAASLSEVRIDGRRESSPENRPGADGTQ